MASVDGSRPTNKPTENVDTFQCTPCEYAGSLKPANKFCRQCEEYMCTPCATLHTSFRQSREHLVLPESDWPPFGQSGVMVKLPVTFCDDHKGENIDWFCEEHDIMFCDTCQLIKHRKCNVTSISDMVKAKTGGHSLSDCVRTMTALQGRIGNLNNEREKNVEDLQRLKKSLEDEVYAFEAELITSVKRLSNDMIKDIHKVVGAEVEVSVGHVKVCDRLIPHVETYLRTADKAKAVADDVTSAIVAHKLTHSLTSLEPTVSDMEQDIYDVNVEFQPSSTLADVFHCVDRLGTLDIDRKQRGHMVPVMSAPHPVSTRRSWSDMEVETSTEIDVSCELITGSTVLPDGRVILADYKNKQVILLDVNFCIQSTLELPDYPWDVASDGTDDIIVAIPGSKKLQWIGVGSTAQHSTLLVGRTVTTDLQCRGVAVNAVEIYTSVCRDWGGSGGHVLVLDRRGAVTRRIGLDAGNDMFSWPVYITVSPRGSVYVSDFFTNHITCFTSTGAVVYDVKHEDIRRPCGMLAADDGSLLVCSNDSDNIHVLGKDGSHSAVIVSSADGVVRPRSVSYRRSDGTLIVTMYKEPSCRAFKVK